MSTVAALRFVELQHQHVSCLVPALQYICACKGIAHARLCATVLLQFCLGLPDFVQQCYCNSVWACQQCCILLIAMCCDATHVASYRVVAVPHWTQSPLPVTQPDTCDQIGVFCVDEVCCLNMLSMMLSAAVRQLPYL